MGIIDKLRAEKAAYAGEEERPLGSFVGLMGVYAAAVGISSAGIVLKGNRLPERTNLGDLALVSVASHKLSRIIAKDPVTSPLRAPFTTFKGTSGDAELEEEVRGTGPRKAMGELLTCPFCVGLWACTGFTFALLTYPRQTRVALNIFTALAAADVLQYAYAKIEESA